MYRHFFVFFFFYSKWRSSGYLKTVLFRRFVQQTWPAGRIHGVCVCCAGRFWSLENSISFFQRNSPIITICLYACCIGCNFDFHFCAIQNQLFIVTCITLCIVVSDDTLTVVTGVISFARAHVLDRINNEHVLLYVHSENSDFKQCMFDANIDVHAATENRTKWSCYLFITKGGWKPPLVKLYISYETKYKLN